MDVENDSLEEALGLLGELMDIRRASNQHLVICGGAALRATNVVSRVTRDVDVLAIRGQVEGEINPAWPLPDDLKSLVEEVATELRLRRDWLNSSTSLYLADSLADLPSQVWSEMMDQNYGSRLKISFVGRLGMIFLKLNAAVHRCEKRDLDDLVALAPTAAECGQFRTHFNAEQLAKFQETVNSVSNGS